MNYYKTRETSLATLLIIKKIPYIGVEPITKSSYYFVFENLEECYEIEKEFLETKQSLLDEINEYPDKQYEKR